MHPYLRCYDFSYGELYRPVPAPDPEAAEFGDQLRQEFRDGMMESLNYMDDDHDADAELANVEEHICHLVWIIEHVNCEDEDAYDCEIAYCQGIRYGLRLAGAR